MLASVFALLNNILPPPPPPGLINLNFFSHRESDSSKSRVTISRLLAVSKPNAHYVLLAFLFLLCAAFGEMFIPYYTGQVIDSIVIGKDSEKFHRSIIIMALLLFVTAICSGLRGGIFSLVLSRFYIGVNKLLFGSILRQEIGFFDKTRTGDIVSRLTSDTSKMGEQLFSHFACAEVKRETEM